MPGRGDALLLGYAALRYHVSNDTATGFHSPLYSLVTQFFEIFLQVFVVSFRFKQAGNKRTGQVRYCWKASKSGERKCSPCTARNYLYLLRSKGKRSHCEHLASVQLLGTAKGQEDPRGLLEPGWKPNQTVLLAALHKTHGRLPAAVVPPPRGDV